MALRRVRAARQSRRCIEMTILTVLKEEMAGQAAAECGGDASVLDVQEEGGGRGRRITPSNGNKSGNTSAGVGFQSVSCIIISKHVGQL